MPCAAGDSIQPTESESNIHTTSGESHLRAQSRDEKGRTEDLPPGWVTVNQLGEEYFVDLNTGQVSSGDPRLYPHLRNVTDQTTAISTSIRLQDGTLAASTDWNRVRPGPEQDYLYLNVETREVLARDPRESKASSVGTERTDDPRRAPLIEACDGSPTDGEHDRGSGQQESQSKSDDADESVPLARNERVTWSDVKQESPEGRYQYKPLKSNEFRLLTIYPDRSGVKCCIQHASLMDPLEYVALSYAWGDLKFDHIIDLVDKSGSCGQIRTTESLWNALCDIRASKLPKVVFADQVTIDQANKSEMGRQVAVMGQVYQQASKVVTYLGPEQEGDREAIEVLRTIYSHFQQRYPTIWEINRDFKRTAAEQRLALSEHHFPVEAPENVWTRVKQFMYGSWTQRLWMAQENILNEETLFLRGTEVLPWLAVGGLHLCYLLHCIPGANLLPVNADEDLSAGISTFDLRMLRRNGTQRTLMQLVWLLSYRGCKLSQDKVYAVLGLVPEIDRLGIIPDYSKETLDVYYDLAAGSLYDRCDLRLLDVVQQFSNPEWPAWPSWIPDWTQSEQDLSFLDTYGGLRGKISASGRLGTNCRFYSRELRLSGIEIDRFGEFISDKCPGRLDAKRTRILWDIVSNLQSYLQSLDVDNVDSKIATTLVAVQNWSPESGAKPSLALRALSKKLVSLKDEPSSLSSKQEEIMTAEEDLTLQEFDSLLPLSWNRRLFVTQNYRVCLGHHGAEYGDVVAVIFGGNPLYILRPIDDGTYRFIGTAFIDGWMTGEALENAYNAKEFRIV